MLSSLLVVAAALLSAPPTPAAPPPAPAVVPSPPVAETEDGPYALLARTAAPAIVDIRFVTHYDTGSGDESQEGASHGVLIDPDGIVLISSTTMFGVEGMGVTFRPQDIKVFVGSDAVGLDAEVVMRDRERDLAWLRITGETPGPLPFVDFTASAAATPGQAVLQVWRLDKFFDRAPYVSAGTVAAVVTRPRELFIASGEITMGLPVFDGSGRVLGFGVVQLPTEEELAAMGGSNPYANVIFGRTVLPASAVAAATEQAMAALKDAAGD